MLLRGLKGSCSVPPCLRAVDLAARLGRSASVLSEEDERQLQWLGAAITQFCDERWAELMRCATAGVWPLLYCHSSDGWSRTVTETKHVRFDDHLVQRRGRLRAEFLLERELLKTLDENGRIHLAMTFTPPRPMLAGKSGWHIFQAATERRDLLRLQAPSNMVLNWYVQDGLHSDQFGRRQAGRHALFYEMLYGDIGSDPSAEERGIVLSWRCSLHVASSAIHWGQLGFAPSPTTVDDIHIGINSLRNSSLTILELVDEFARERVRFS